MADSIPAAPRGRVLLIDDDRVFGLWATKVLESRGLAIKHVLDPMSGLKAIEAEPWDAVITDIEMPRMSGIEFLERVRRLEPDLPVVVVTAHPTVDRAVAAMRQRGTDFVHKPVTAEEFAAKVSALAAQHRAASAATSQESVLAIGAHPGDPELGAAGALLAHQAAGVAVTILTLSPGANGESGTAAGREPRDATTGGPGPGDATATAGALGTRVALEDLVGPGSGGADPVGAAIEKLIAQTQPTVLYTHSIHDDQEDHRNAHLASIAAARRIGRVYCFQSPSATIEFQPTRFVPIGDQLGGKLLAVAAFAAQAEVRAFLEPDQVTPTALYWARYCQGQHAEAFEVVRDSAAGQAPER
jgi:two-component system, NtrC family, response regulator HydG